MVYKYALLEEPILTPEQKKIFGHLADERTVRNFNSEKVAEKTLKQFKLKYGKKNKYRLVGCKFNKKRRSKK